MDANKMDAKKLMPRNGCQQIDANKGMPTNGHQQMDANKMDATRWMPNN